jgi:hypothetical protein
MKSAISTSLAEKETEPFYIRLLDDITLCNIEWFKMHTNIATSAG